MTAAPPIKILTACAEKWALQCAIGEMDVQAAVDGLQCYAEHSGLVAELGQDRVQDVIAAAFIWAREVADADEVDDTIDPDYAAQIIRRWELADPRDRWIHTGEAPPAIEISPATKPAYRTPQATIDAFWCAVRIDDPDLIARWLAGHPADAAHLHEIWGQKCAIAA